MRDNLFTIMQKGVKPQLDELNEREKLLLTELEQIKIEKEKINQILHFSSKMIENMQPQKSTDNDQNQ